jgi:hypothetical protein
MITSKVRIFFSFSLDEKSANFIFLIEFQLDFIFHLPRDNLATKKGG